METNPPYKAEIKVVDNTGEVIWHSTCTSQDFTSEISVEGPKKRIIVFGDVSDEQYFDE